MSAYFPWLGGIPDEEIACVVAHQDDETVFSSLFGEHPGVHLIQVTDGGPLQSDAWQGLSRESYAALRQRELAASLHAARHRGAHTTLNFIDGTAAFSLCRLVKSLYWLFMEQHIRACCTHAYEGGHPDHDAIALAVAIAASNVLWPVVVVEAPLYRMPESGSELVWQQFVPFEGVELVMILLSPQEQERKAAMYAAHASQKDVFPHLSLSHEFFRTAPAYDFSRLPNAGRISRYWESTGIDERAWSLAVQACL